MRPVRIIEHGTLSLFQLLRVLSSSFLRQSVIHARISIEFFISPMFEVLHNVYRFGKLIHVTMRIIICLPSHILTEFIIFFFGNILHVM